MFIAGVNFGLGSPAGGPTSSSGKPAASPAKWELTLLTKTASDAQALAKSIDLGLQTGVMLNSRKPYHEVISDWKIAVDSKNPIVTAELTFAADTPPGVWRNLIAQRDLGFLAGS